MSATLKRTATEDKEVSPPPTKRRINASTTNKAVVNFFKPISQKDPIKTAWRTVDGSLLVCKYDKVDEYIQNAPRRVAAFDLDSTLISTSSGKKYGATADDWRWWHAYVEGSLRKAVADGYLVIVLSNQAGLTIEADPKQPASIGKRVVEFKGKIDSILTQLDLPISLYAATQHDIYRKPRVGMWRQMLVDHGLSESGKVDLEHSFYVGDAAGRVTSTTSQAHKKDFSCSDRDLAANIGIPFHTPEEYFLNEGTRSFVRTFDPIATLQTLLQSTSPANAFVKQHSQEIVIFVGSPGAGKSTFYWTQLEPHGYMRVNQDILKTRDNCLRAATTYLKQGQSMAVDNTNADIDTRKHWITLAEQHDVPIRCVLFTASAKLCEHNDTVRALGGALMNPESRTMLPKMAFSGFASRYREPSLKEGFTDIHKVPFQFAGTDEQRAVWGRYWLSG